MTDRVDAEAIAAGLGPSDIDFLRRVCEGRPLGCADRAEDRVRQRVRRMGLTYVAKTPRRWEARPLGLAVRDVLMKEKG